MSLIHLATFPIPTISASVCTTVCTTLQNQSDKLLRRKRQISQISPHLLERKRALLSAMLQKVSPLAANRLRGKDDPILVY